MTRAEHPELRQVAAQEHDAVGVVDDAVRGRQIGRRAAVLGDVDLARGSPEHMCKI
jgi:hypothetical protein